MSRKERIIFATATLASAAGIIEMADSHPISSAFAESINSININIPHQEGEQKIENPFYPTIFEINPTDPNFDTILGETASSILFPSTEQIKSDNSFEEGQLNINYLNFDNKTIFFTTIDQPNQSTVFIFTNSENQIVVFEKKQDEDLVIFTNQDNQIMLAVKNSNGEFNILENDGNESNFTNFTKDELLLLGFRIIDTTETKHSVVTNPNTVNIRQTPDLSNSENIITQSQSETLFIVTEDLRDFWGVLIKTENGWQYGFLHKSVAQNALVVGTGTTDPLRTAEIESREGEAIVEVVDQNEIFDANGEYTGTPWDGEYAVTLDSEITVNAETNQTNGILTINNQQYLIEASPYGYSFGSTDTNKFIGYGGSGVFAGIVGTRNISQLSIPNGDSIPNSTIEHLLIYDLLIMVKQQNNAFKPVIISVPSGPTYGGLRTESHDQAITGEEYLSWIQPGSRVAYAFYTQSGSNTLQFVNTLAISSYMNDLRYATSTILSICLTNNNRENLQAVVDNRLTSSPTYLGFPVNYISYSKK